MLFLWQIVSDPKTSLGWLKNWLARLHDANSCTNEPLILQDTNNVLSKRKISKGPECLDKEAHLAEIPSKIQKTQNNQTVTSCLKTNMSETKQEKKIRVWMDGW